MSPNGLLDCLYIHCTLHMLITCTCTLGWKTELGWKDCKPLSVRSLSLNNLVFWPTTKSDLSVDVDIPHSCQYLLCSFFLHCAVVCTYKIWPSLRCSPNTWRTRPASTSPRDGSSSNQLITSDLHRQSEQLVMLSFHQLIIDPKHCTSMHICFWMVPEVWLVNMSTAYM